jgi:hypothetical protein
VAGPIHAIDSGFQDNPVIADCIRPRDEVLEGEIQMRFLRLAQDLREPAVSDNLTRLQRVWRIERTDRRQLMRSAGGAALARSEGGGWSVHKRCTNVGADCERAALRPHRRPSGPARHQQRRQADVDCHGNSNDHGRPTTKIRTSAYLNASDPATVTRPVFSVVTVSSAASF